LFETEQIQLPLLVLTFAAARIMPWAQSSQNMFHDNVASLVLSLLVVMLANSMRRLPILITDEHLKHTISQVTRGGLNSLPLTYLTTVCIFRSFF
jgi:uncharacterized membrane protein